jgi:transcriptional regulator with XRE-family HTH domain
MNIGRSIKVACAQKDMNQRQLAELTGISTVTISHLISGKTQCKQSTLTRLSEAFKIPASEFIALGE